MTAHLCGGEPRFGLRWIGRDDGDGFEIKGISGQMMRLFSWLICHDVPGLGELTISGPEFGRLLPVPMPW
jgi:hypothetical protein